MTNAQWWDLIGQGSAAWNRWREDHPEIHIDLRGLYMAEQHLGLFNFSGADLREAHLRRAWDSVQAADFANESMSYEQHYRRLLESLKKAPEAD